MLYETAQLIVEFAEMLPSTELVTELKISVISVTQKCTDKSWEHLEGVGKRLMENPEIKDFTMPMEDQIYFVKHSTTILMCLILGLIQKHFQTVFG